MFIKRIYDFLSELLGSLLGGFVEILIHIKKRIYDSQTKRSILSLLCLIIWLIITIWSFSASELPVAIFYSISCSVILFTFILVADPIGIRNKGDWFILIAWLIIIIGPFFLFKPFTATLVSVAVAIFTFYLLLKYFILALEQDGREYGD